MENPYEEVYLRQLAKRLGLSPYSVKRYADLMLKEKIIRDERKANLRYLKADTSNLFFRYLKISFAINNIIKSGLIKFLDENIPNLSSITIFGSTARGEDDNKSDIDILAIGKEKYLKLDEFERKLGKKINMHIRNWSGWNSEAKKNRAFYYEVITHGIPLFGELPIAKWK